MPSVSDLDWYKKHLKCLLDLGDQMDHSGEVIEYGAHTCLKLICVRYYSEVFSAVARNPRRLQQRMEGAVYVDLFAGPGLVRVIETGDLVGGSPICAYSNKYHFDYMVMVEKDPARRRALQGRVSRMAESRNFKVIEGDCNSRVQEVISSIQERYPNPIVLVFVDPEGMEIKWSTLEALSSAFAQCDFIINLNAGTGRVTSRLGDGDQTVRGRVEDFYGDDASEVLKDIAEGRPPEDRYVEKVRTVLGKQVGQTIKIWHEGNRLEYYILVYTRMTAGGSRYAENSLPGLRNRIEAHDSGFVKKVLDVLKSRQMEI
jgi:three-Cys-motif partner protein